MAELRTIDAEPVADDVVDTLERALVKARAGELSAVAIAVVYRDGASGSSWSHMHSIPAMIGSVSRLQHKLNMDADG
jgi:hypothetical protein